MAQKLSAQFRAGVNQILADEIGYATKVLSRREFEVWEGGLDFICLLGLAKNKKWYATHNMTLDIGTYDTALEALEAYRSKRKGST